MARQRKDGSLLSVWRSLVVEGLHEPPYYFRVPHPCSQPRPTPNT